MKLPIYLKKIKKKKEKRLHRKNIYSIKIFPTDLSTFIPYWQQVINFFINGNDKFIVKVLVCKEVT